MKPIIRTYWLLLNLGWLVALLVGACSIVPMTVVWVFTGKEPIDLWMNTMEKLEKHRDEVFSKAR